MRTTLLSLLGSLAQSASPVLPAPLALSALLATSALAATDPPGQLPASEAGKKVEALLQAYNAGTEEALLSFVKEQYPATVREKPRACEAVAAYWRSIYKEYGPVRFVSVLTNKDHEVEVWARGTLSESWVTFTVEVSPQPPHEVAGTGVGRGIAPQAGARTSPPSPRELARVMTRYLDALGRADHFSGTVAVARGPELILTSSQGLADRDHDVRNRPETRFNIASLSKMFTAVAILQLAEARRLSLDDPLSKHIPEYPQAIAEKVTLRHLLTHRSGIELDDDAEYNAAARTTRSVPELLKTHLKFLPKMKGFDAFALPVDFDYSNEGYDLLGAVIERVSKVSYEEYLRDHIFKKAGMTSTGSYDIEATMPNAAIGYTMRDGAKGAYHLGPLLKSSLWMPYASTPSGCHFATARDLVRFADALLAHQLLGPEMTRTALSAQLARGDSGGAVTSYGLGFELNRMNGVVSVGHSGGLPGASARLDIYPDLGYTVAVLSNSGWVANNVADRARELLSGLH